MDKEGKCCFCNNRYTEYGKATWGYWTYEQEKMAWGEDKRCCDSCYIEKIVPARRRKAAGIKAGVISTVLEDLPEDFLYEE
ncbi:MAG: hypothetical protein IJZ27_04980 [Treponema sp.]|nr:hypothetical protein [Treponema sp.]MBQ8777708.1 hypothetical protein [Treponema sp.]